MQFFDLGKGALVRTIPGLAAAGRAIVFAPDGRALVVGDERGALRLLGLDAPPDRR